MSLDQPTLAARVSTSLERTGFTNIKVIDLGSGEVRLECESLSPDEKLQARQVARSVSGVSKVVGPVEYDSN